MFCTQVIRSKLLGPKCCGEVVQSTEEGGRSAGWITFVTVPWLGTPRGLGSNENGLNLATSMLSLPFSKVRTVFLSSSVHIHNFCNV